MLGRWNVCSKQYVVRQYDHEVQAGSVVKPLTGRDNDGPTDAAVVRPDLTSFGGVVVSHGICPKYSRFDAYHMAACAVDEAVRNNIASGGSLSHMALLDNFCWCDPVASEKNPDGEYKLAQLVRANKALYDYTVLFGTPLISGKDSMKNDYVNGDTRISIPPTLLVSAISAVKDVTKVRDHGLQGRGRSDRCGRKDLCRACGVRVLLGIGSGRKYLSEGRWRRRRSRSTGPWKKP